MIRKLLIANRGEIACRIGRTCQKLGIPFTAVYSAADRNALHLSGAATTVAIGPASGALSYLDGEALVRAAIETGCDALHPGYGFLSENAAFAAAVEAAGLIFVGPTPETIAKMGNKATAKMLMADAGVPVVPGSSDATDDPATVARLVLEVGYPALLKPVAGGGGKGMAVIESGDGREAIGSAIRTANASFGDGRLIVERLIRKPRHIEVQIFGDDQGNVVHLFERECSLQRRHQKIVEEAPAANISSGLRDALIEAAVRGAEALRYRNAGTFEFIVDREEAFYFLEVNTRLQVEHPVTEAITGVDLVEWQLKVAGGAPIPLSQGEIIQTGHAIECRLCAEDAARGFQPAPGHVAKVHWPDAVRVETGIEDGSSVPSHYDPMIAKVITHAKDRTDALAAMRSALEETVIAGLTTNLGFLSRLLCRPEVSASKTNTRFVDDALSELVSDVDDTRAFGVAAAAIVMASTEANNAPRSPWLAVGAQSSDRSLLDPEAPLGRVPLAIGALRSTVALKAAKNDDLTVAMIGDESDGNAFNVTGRAVGNFAKGFVGGEHWYAVIGRQTVDLTLSGTRIVIDRIDAAVPESDGGDAAVAVDMPGIVVAINVTAGAKVREGDVLAVVEAMKFENAIIAARDGIIAEVLCSVGEQIAAGQPLVRFEPERSASSAMPETGGA